MDEPPDLGAGLSRSSASEMSSTAEQSLKCSEKYGETSRGEIKPGFTMYIHLYDSSWAFLMSVDKVAHKSKTDEKDV